MSPESVAEDIPEGIEALESGDSLPLQLFRGDLSRLKNGVMAVVKRPLPGKKSSLRFELLEKRRPRQRCENGKLQAVDLGMEGKINGIANCLYRVGLAAKNKHAVHPDFRLVKTAHAFADILHALLLVQSRQCSRIDRFHPHKSHISPG